MRSATAQGGDVLSPPLLTPTAIELMNDPEFWYRRMNDQDLYIIDLVVSQRPHMRKIELMASASAVRERCFRSGIKLVNKK